MTHAEARVNRVGAAAAGEWVAGLFSGAALPERESDTQNDRTATNRDPKNPVRLSPMAGPTTSGFAAFRGVSSK